MQRYEKILNYANKNAKNVRKIYENVRNLSESAIKELIPESDFGAMEEGRRRRRRRRRRERKNKFQPCHSRIEPEIMLGM